MKKKINLFKKKIYLQKFAFVCSFLLCFCTLGAALNVYAPKTASVDVVAHAYDENTAWLDCKEVLPQFGAYGAVYEPIYAFEGFDTLAVGEYADGVPSGKTQITDFKKNDNLQFYVSETAKIGKRFKVESLSVSQKYYVGGLTLNFPQNATGQYAVVLFPAFGVAITPQVYLINAIGAKRSVRIDFPEYVPELENIFDLICVFHKTKISEYGNAMPVFEGSPKYEVVNKIQNLQNYLFYPDAFNVRADGVAWFNAARLKSIADSAENRQKIELTAPIMGVWQWKSNVLNFENELYTSPLSIEIGGETTGAAVLPFVSDNAIFAELSITQSPLSVKYDALTILSDVKTDFDNPNKKTIFWVQDATHRGTFLDTDADGQTIFLFKNFDFYVPQGVDEREEQRESRLDMILSFVIGGTILVTGLALATFAAYGTAGASIAPGVALMGVGLGVMGLGVSNASKTGLVPKIIENVGAAVSNLFKKIGKVLSNVIRQLVVWFWEFLKGILPGADKTIFYNVGFVIVAALLLTGLVIAIIESIKNKN